MLTDRAGHPIGAGQSIHPPAPSDIPNLALPPATYRRGCGPGGCRARCRRAGSAGGSRCGSRAVAAAGCPASEPAPPPPPPAPRGPAAPPTAPGAPRRAAAGSGRPPAAPDRPGRPGGPPPRPAEPWGRGASGLRRGGGRLPASPGGHVGLRGRAPSMGSRAEASRCEPSGGWCLYAPRVYIYTAVPLTYANEALRGEAAFEIVNPLPLASHLLPICPEAGRERGNGGREQRAPGASRQGCAARTGIRERMNPCMQTGTALGGVGAPGPAPEPGWGVRAVHRGTGARRGGGGGGKREKGRYLRARPAQTHMKGKKHKDLTVLLPVSETLIKSTALPLPFITSVTRRGIFKEIGIVREVLSPLQIFPRT